MHIIDGNTHYSSGIYQNQNPAPNTVTSLALLSLTPIYESASKLNLKKVVPLTLGLSLLVAAAKKSAHYALCESEHGLTRTALETLIGIGAWVSVTFWITLSIGAPILTLYGCYQSYMTERNQALDIELGNQNKKLF